MNANYAFFHACHDMDAARATFRELCKRYHPDTGGDAETFRAMVSEFQQFQRDVWANSGRAKWGTAYQPKPDSHNLPEQTFNRLSAVLRWPDITVEILGTWLWVQGDTRKYTKEFRKLAFQFSSKKSAWFYHYEAYRKRYGRDYSMEELRTMHAGQTMEQEPDAAVA